MDITTRNQKKGQTSIWLFSVSLPYRDRADRRDLVMLEPPAWAVSVQLRPGQGGGQAGGDGLRQAGEEDGQAEQEAPLAPNPSTLRFGRRRCRWRYRFRVLNRAA